MRRSVIHHELIFDSKVPGGFRPLTRQEEQAQRLPKPEPMDVFRNDPQKKLWRMSGMKDEDGSLAFALNSIRHFFMVTGMN